MSNDAVRTEVYLQFSWVGALMADNDSVLRRGVPDIPCVEAT